MMPRSSRASWATAGQCDRRGARLFGFSEADAANAAVRAYYSALVVAQGDRARALDQLQEEFRAAVAGLGG